MVRLLLVIIFLFGLTAKASADWVDLDGKKAQLLEGKTKNCVSDGIVSVQKIKNNGFEFQLGALHRFLVENSKSSEGLSKQDGCSFARTTEVLQNRVVIKDRFYDCQDKNKNHEIVDQWSMERKQLTYTRTHTRGGVSSQLSFCRFGLKAR